MTLELVRRGYTEEQIGKIWSGNLLRVWGEVEKVAAFKRAFKASEPPPTSNSRGRLRLLTCPLRHYRQTVGHKPPCAGVECCVALHLPLGGQPLTLSGWCYEYEYPTRACLYGCAAGGRAGFHRRRKREPVTGSDRQFRSRQRQLLPRRTAGGSGLYGPRRDWRQDAREPDQRRRRSC